MKSLHIIHYLVVKIHVSCVQVCVCVCVRERERESERERERERCLPTEKMKKSLFNAHFNGKKLLEIATT